MLQLQELCIFKKCLLLQCSLPPLLQLCCDSPSFSLRPYPCPDSDVFQSTSAREHGSQQHLLRSPFLMYFHPLGQARPLSHRWQSGIPLFSLPADSFLFLLPLPPPSRTFQRPSRAAGAGWIPSSPRHRWARRASCRPPSPLGHCPHSAARAAQTPRRCGDPSGAAPHTPRPKRRSGREGALGAAPQSRTEPARRCPGPAAAPIRAKTPLSRAGQQGRAPHPPGSPRPRARLRPAAPSRSAAPAARTAGPDRTEMPLPRPPLRPGRVGSGPSLRRDYPLPEPHGTTPTPCTAALGFLIPAVPLQIALRIFLSPHLSVFFPLPGVCALPPSSCTSVIPQG